MADLPRVLIGISGWNYPQWRGVFYPRGLRQADELGFASRVFPSIEVNGSFYSQMRPSSYRGWYAAVPEDFVFALKGARFITHMKRLRDVETPLANFFASGPLCLRAKLGPILWQLPPSVRFDPLVLRAFFELLPKTFQQARRLARKHDHRLRERAAFAVDENRPLRHALEVRHESFYDPDYVDLLREYGIASCVADSAGRYPVIEDLTADFAYVRLHGASQLYVSGYGPRELKAWAARVRSWQNSGRPVFVYFDNDVKVRAPFDALNLTRLLAGQSPRRVPSSLAFVTEEARGSAKFPLRAAGASAVPTRGQGGRMRARG